MLAACFRNVGSILCKHALKKIRHEVRKLHAGAVKHYSF